MVAIAYMKTSDGIIKSYIDYNPFWNKIQVHIDGVIYGEFFPNEYQDAKEYLEKSLSESNIIKPDIHIITDDRPLEVQLKEMTGDPLTTCHYEYLDGPSLLRNIKTGLIIQIIQKAQIQGFINGLLKANNHETE